MENSSNYLDPRTLASLEGLDLQARMVVEGYVSGLHRSPYHGFSVEFAEHREYVPGDDIKHVDWKVWSKTDKLYLKQYEEETNLVLHLLLDVSESMGYASPGNVSKLKYSEFIAASLAYLVLQQRDSVGLATFSDKIEKILRPSGQASHLKDIIHVMHSTPAREKTDLGQIFHDLAERLGRRGVVVVLSDLFDDVDRVMTGLKHFRHRRHEVVLFHIMDPAEVEFPFVQTTLFHGLEGVPDILAEPRALRAAYTAEVDAFRNEVQRRCRIADIDYVFLRTDQRLDVALSSYLAARSARLR